MITLSQTEFLCFLQECGMDDKQIETIFQNPEIEEILEKVWEYHKKQTGMLMSMAIQAQTNGLYDELPTLDNAVEESESVRFVSIYSEELPEHIKIRFPRECLYCEEKATQVAVKGNTFFYRCCNNPKCMDRAQEEIIKSS